MYLWPTLYAPPMDTNQIIVELTQQRDRVVAAIKALTGTNRADQVLSRNGRKKRTLSAEAKRKLSLVAKARWAKAKKSGKNALNSKLTSRLSSDFGNHR